MTEETDLPEQTRVRLGKRERMLAAGDDPYPPGFPRTDTIAEVRRRYAELGAGAATGDRVGVVGRVLLSRPGGKLSFATIRDGTGEIQVMISLDRSGPTALDAWKRDVDIGDHVGVEGEVITSRRGELSVLADRFAITAKSLRPLPEKHKGLTDPEARVRQRYVDLIVNPQAREMVELRSTVLSALRAGLYARGRRGRDARPAAHTQLGEPHPFVTRDARDPDVYLRIRWSCLSSGWSSGASRRSSRSADLPPTKASRHHPLTPFSPCSRPTRRTATTTRSAP